MNPYPPLPRVFLLSCICGVALAACAGAPTATPTNPPPTLTRVSTATPRPTVSTNEHSLGYDGVYRGLTSQERMLELTIEDGGVRSILLDFEIPDCTAQNYSPMSSYFGEVKGEIENGVLTLKEGNGLVITGTFASATEVAGTLVVKSFLCEGSATLTWSASTDFVPVAPTPSPELLALIPEMEISAGLFQPEAGADNVDQMEGIISSQGDWILIRNFQSVFPIPAGWTTAETGQETIIAFSPDGNLDDPSVLIRLGGVGYIGDNRPSEEVMAEFEKGLKEIPSAVLFDKKIVNASQGYYFLTVTTEAGQQRYLMVLFSEDVQGFFHRFIMFTDPEDWEDYYPIVQEIVAHWVDLELKPLGMPLPEQIPTDNPISLYEPPAFPPGTWEIVPEDQAVFPANTNINALVVDKLGQLWAGTAAGLRRLDADGKWTTYVPDDSDSSYGISDLAVDDQGRVWTDAGGGIRMFDPSTGVWTTKIEGRGTNALAIDKQNRVWMGTYDGLFVMDSNGKEDHYTADNSGLKYDRIDDLAIDAQGNVWMANYLALTKLDANGKWTSFETETDLPAGTVTSIAIDRQGQTWAGTSDCLGPSCGGLSVLNAQSQWTVYNPPADVTTLATDAQGRVWVGTSTGLHMLDSTGKWTTYTPENSGIAPGGVKALAIDQQGQLWAKTVWLNVLGSDGKWKTYTPEVLETPGFYDDWSDNLIVDQQGRIWVTTFGENDGLNVFSLDGRWTNYTTHNSPLVGNSIEALAIDRQGNLWVATFDEGVNVITPDGQWETYDAETLELGDEIIYGLAIDQQDRVWLGTSKELKMFEPDGGWRTYDTDGLGYDDVNVEALAIDEQGQVWARIWVLDLQEYQVAIFTP